MLSNFHVMCIDNTHTVGDTMCNPGRVDGGSCPANVVGALRNQSLGGEVDCAVADHNARGWACEIVDIGAIAGTSTASVGQAVRKRGRTTLLTYGTVDTVDLTTTIDYGAGIGSVTLVHQIGVKPDTAKNPKFSDHGDSGAVVVNDSVQIVGLNFAGDPTGYAIANPIASVLSALNVEVCSHLKQPVKEIKVEKVEIKEHKELKPEIKEHKEFKVEKNEIKELKVEKNERKEHKLEKFEKLEHERIPKPFEIPHIPPGPLGPPVGGGFQHFIGSELRPDLSSGALSGEEDLQALRSELEQRAVEAKSIKDSKDTKELSER
jgi:hypothetical protein